MEIIISYDMLIFIRIYLTSQVRHTKTESNYIHCRQFKKKPIFNGVASLVLVLRIFHTQIVPEKRLHLGKE